MPQCTVCDKPHITLDDCGYCCYEEKKKISDKRGKLINQINQCLEKHGLELRAIEIASFLETIVNARSVDNRVMTEWILEWIKKNCEQ